MPTLPVARPLAVAALLAVLVGCNTEPPATPEGDYYAAMAPVVQDNAAISKELEALAVQVKKGEADAEAVAGTLDDTVLSRARSVAQAAADVDPGSDELADAHAVLVGAWEERVDILDDALAAWRKADADAAAAATERRYNAARAEARSFDRINAILVEEGYVLQPY